MNWICRSVQGTFKLVCMSVVAMVAIALVPNEADAKGCSEHLLTKSYGSQARPTDVPKTRRIKKARKPQPAAQAKPTPVPAAVTSVVVRAQEKDYDPSRLEELVVELLYTDSLADDPRRTAPAALRYIRLDFGLVTNAVPLLIVLDERDFARSIQSELLARLLPTHHASDDSDASVG